MLAGHIWLSFSKHGAGRIVSATQVRQILHELFSSQSHINQIFFFLIITKYQIYNNFTKISLKFHSNYK
jgi:hypothetical protein